MRGALKTDKGMQKRSNKANRSKESILADVKNLLFVLHPAMQQMPKIERIDGAPQMMKAACYDLIGHYTVAREDPEVRIEYIRAMWADFGKILAAFELCVQCGFFTDKVALRIAEQIERIQEGIRKWRNATRSPKSEARCEVGEPGSQECAASDD